MPEAKMSAAKKSSRDAGPKSFEQDGSLFERLEKASVTPEPKKWSGTFRDFLREFEKGTYPNMGILSHQRVERMIASKPTEKVDHFGHTRTRYDFFEKHLFGIEGALDNLMAFLQAAARKTETARRMLLLYGPPSSGKSDLVAIMKKGLEQYTRTNAGAIFALSDTKMLENPFILIPDEMRPEFEKKYGLRIEGHLSPPSLWRLKNEFDGKFMEFPVEQVFLSEADRIGIGTWLPQDPKSQDQSELVGSLDFNKIQKYGSEADPRAFNFDGELNVANRGIMEFIEGLKADERFLRVLLTATQEKSIKAPRFGMISVDTFIIMHTNEEEFKSFMAERKYEAYHDRMVIISVPYNLGYSNEVKIYEKLLEGSETGNIHLAPQTLQSAAMFAVLSRLEPPGDGDLTLIKKMKLYNGERVKGYKIEQVHDLKKKSPREGMSGVSPRFVIDQISIAISRAAEEGRNFVTALDILRQLNQGVLARDSFKKEDKTRYNQYMDLARSEFDTLLKNDIQKAFFLSFVDEAKTLCAKYLDHIEAALSDSKPRDPVTDEEEDLDESLMDNIETHLDISQSGKTDFRNEILRFFGTAARKGRTVDYTQHAQLREAIQKQMFEERQGVIRMTVSERNPDPEALRRLNEVVDRMVQQQGYTAESSNELLKYASAHLFDK